MVELLDYDWKFGLVIIIGIIMFFDIVFCLKIDMRTSFRMF